MEVVVDGERSRLVNLSVTGAQLVMPARVQPRQSILLTLVDHTTEKRVRALVAWSTVELAQSEDEVSRRRQLRRSRPQHHRRVLPPERGGLRRQG